MKRLMTILSAMVLSVSCLLGTAAAESKIVIGIIPEQNLVKQMERFTPLCKYLGAKIGMEVGVKPLANYGLIYEEMRDGKIDAGFFGSFVYGMTRSRIGIEPVARPVRPDGSSTYTGITFVRKDSGIKKPADMKGKTIALVDPATTAGYLAQKDYFAKQGLNIDKDVKIFWAGSHDAVITAVMNKQAEIGGAKNVPINKFRKENKAFDETMTIVDEAPKPPVPDNTFAVRKDMGASVKEKLKNALLNMAADEDGKAVLAKFGASKFTETTDGDFKSLYGMVKGLKLDLKTYPYKKQ